MNHLNSQEKKKVSPKIRTIIFVLEITLIIVLVVLWFSSSSLQKSKSLIVLFLYSFPSQFLISIVPHEPVLLYFGKFYPPITAALVAVSGTLITEALNYSVFKFVTDFKLFKKSLQKKTVSKIVDLFNKAPFTAIWVAGLTPIPFYPIRFLVVLAHYPLIKYLLAVFLSRLPRFYILALIGYAIKIPDYLLIVLFVVLIISIYIPVLRNLIKKRKNKNRGDID